MNYNEFYLHFYYSTNFTSVSFKSIFGKKRKSFLFGKTTQNISIASVMKFLLQDLKIFTSARKHVPQMRPYSGDRGKWSSVSEILHGENWPLTQ